jgi:hypothetical protein
MPDARALVIVVSAIASTATVASALAPLTLASALGRSRWWGLAGPLGA